MKKNGDISVRLDNFQSHDLNCKHIGNYLGGGGGGGGGWRAPQLVWGIRTRPHTMVHAPIILGGGAKSTFVG